MRAIRGAAALVATGAILVLILVAVQARDRTAVPGAASEPPADASFAPTDNPSFLATDAPSATPTESLFNGKTWPVDEGDHWTIARFGANAIDLPEGELYLTSTDQLVVTTIHSNAASSTLIVRELASGVTVAKTEVAFGVGAAALSQGAVWYTGISADGSDPGVYELDLANSTVTVAVEGGQWPADWSSGSRFDLKISRSGLTIAAPACGPREAETQRCFVDVIRPTDKSVTRPVTDLEGYVAAVSDRAIFTLDRERRSLKAFDLDGGKQTWQVADGYVSDLYATSDSSSLITDGTTIDSEGSAKLRRVVVVDANSGLARFDLTFPIEEKLTLWPELSTDETAVLGHGERLRDAFSSASTLTADLLDLQSAVVSPDALTVSLAP